MALWQDPRWFDANRRKRQLDDHITATGETRFGIRQYHTEDKSGAVIRHFNRVAPKYDLMNSLLSMGIQHVWKRQAVRMLSIRPGDRVLDVCGGTGDLSILAGRRTGVKGQVVIYDINQAMIQAGRHKIDPYPELRHITCALGDAEQLAFPDNCFDVAMVGFGIRNVTHIKRGFQEMVRVLKPGGRLLCLEFSRPTNRIFRQLYDFYSFNVMPLLGALITGSAESYACLPETIRMFPLPDELSALLGDVGLHCVRYRRMTNSIAVAHVGVKPGKQEIDGFK